MKLKENDVTFLEEADDDINSVDEEVILVVVEDMVDDEIDVDVDDDLNVVVEDVNMVEEVVLVDDEMDVDGVADGELDDTVEVDMKVDNEGDVADDDKDVEEVDALEKNVKHQNYFV